VIVHLIVIVVSFEFCFFDGEKNKKVGTLFSFLFLPKKNTTLSFEIDYFMFRVQDETRERNENVK
jgi:hypothetical protein